MDEEDAIVFDSRIYRSDIFDRSLKLIENETLNVCMQQIFVIFGDFGT